MWKFSDENWRFTAFAGQLKSVICAHCITAKLQTLTQTQNLRIKNETEKSEECKRNRKLSTHNLNYGLNRTNNTCKPIASQFTEWQWTKFSTSTCACVISHSCWSQRTSSNRYILFNWRYNGRHYSMSRISQSVFGKFQNVSFLKHFIAFFTKRKKSKMRDPFRCFHLTKQNLNWNSIYCQCILIFKYKHQFPLKNAMLKF